MRSRQVVSLMVILMSATLFTVSCDNGLRPDSKLIRLHSKPSRFLRRMDCRDKAPGTDEWRSDSAGSRAALVGSGSRMGPSSALASLEECRKISCNAGGHASARRPRSCS